MRPKSKFVIAFIAMLSLAFAPGPGVTSNQTADAAASPGCAVDLGGLIGWWRGDSDATADTGTDLTGSASFVAGKSGQALSFNGLSALNAPAVPGVSTALTVEAWVKPAPTTNPTVETIVGRWNFPDTDDAARSYALSFDTRGDLIWSTDETSTQRPVDFRVSAPVLLDGNFHHVAATWDAASMTIYVDGAAVGTRQSQGGVLNAANSTGVRIGSQLGLGSPLYFNGAIDEPSIWSRALTASEVAAISNAGAAGKCTAPTPANAPSLVSGVGHLCTLRADGTVACWGSNASGQLANGATSGLPTTTPTQVAGLSGVTQLSSDYDSACAVLQDRTVKCWGLNTFGQLGDGTTTRATSPVAVSGITNAVQVAVGQIHSCAVLIDSTIKCWGGNFAGGLGNGTTSASLTPVPVSGISNASQVDVQNDHSCALLKSGAVKCWGGNFWGQLGNGTTIDSLVPVPVSGLRGATQVSLGNGGQNACALIVDGTIRCWGLNSGGQLGNGTTANSSTAVVVSGVTTAVQVSSNQSHGCAVLLGGSVKCWGQNQFGQLGNGTTTSSATPVTVSGVNTAVQVTTGVEHSCATLADSTIVCWGANGNAGIQSLTPTAVPG